MGTYGVVVLLVAAWNVWRGAAPEPAVMAGVGLLALGVNAGVAVLLYAFRDGDANMRAVWLCTRNDVIGNVAVLLAAAGVFGTGTVWPDVGVAALMAVLGIHAAVSVVRRARGELRSRSAEGAPGWRDWLEVRVPPVAVMALAAAAIVATELVVPTPATRPEEIAVLIGIALAAAGLTLSLAGVVGFRAARTTVDPLHPERSVVLVRQGVYRLSRNPMYVGFVAALLGLAVALSSPVGLLLAFGTAVYLDRFQIEPEERVLLQRFGHEYERYKRSVRRWL
jgi:protein-S-isoprenylcysteine O-methyltransferase Ste14